jgi:hypothetical protein
MPQRFITAPPLQFKSNDNKKIEIEQKNASIENIKRQQASSTQPDPLQQRLDGIAQTYRDMIANSRRRGYPVAADNLQRFLNGTGGTKTESVPWLKSFSAITDAERTNQERFETRLKREALALGTGATSTFTDHWDRSLTGGVTTELYYASGTSNIRSTGTFTLTRTGNTIRISGTVTHVWNDPYDWHAGLSAYIPGSGRISDEDALLLQQHRGAAPFHMTASWNQTLSGNYLVDNFLYFDSSQFTWR